MAKASRNCCTSAGDVLRGANTRCKQRSGLARSSNQLDAVSPQAPGMFCTISVGLPGIYFPIWHASTRPSASEPPPAGKPTMTRTVFPLKGASCALINSVCAMTNKKPSEKIAAGSSWIPSFKLGCLIASHDKVASNFGHPSRTDLLRSPC
jgi:hypothetical protein